jgi:hypothetical protein
VSNTFTLLAKASLFTLIGLSLSGCQKAPDTMPLDAVPAQVTQHMQLIYDNPMQNAEDMTGWQMEGPGQVSFDNNWMQMWSPDEAMHHVYWAPIRFPGSFVASWQAQALNTEAGLVIVFFAAKGMNGESIFDSQLLPRNGTFAQYTEGDIKSYHISYYANAAHNPDRQHANLRKNNTFSLLQKGKVGIPAHSTKPHTITLVKQSAHIQLFINDEKVIDYIDNTPVVDNVDTGKPLADGYIGFRQMKWTQFQYRNLKVWAYKNS